MKELSALPDEVLADIFLSLDAKTRLNCSLVCKRWTRILAKAPMLHDILLKIQRISFSEIVSTINFMERSYPNISLYVSAFGFREEVNPYDSNFASWQLLSINVKELTLFAFEIKLNAFNALLKSCVNLRSLNIECDLPFGFFCESVLVEQFVVMPKITSLSINCDISAAALNGLMHSLPGLEKVELVIDILQCDKFDLVQKADKLLHLAIMDDTRFSESFDFHFDFSRFCNLRYLAYSHFLNIDKSLSYLKSLTNLRHLQLPIFQAQPETALEIPEGTLSKLETLRVGNRLFSEKMTLDCPELRELQLTLDEFSLGFIYIVPNLRVLRILDWRRWTKYLFLETIKRINCNHGRLEIWFYERHVRFDSGFVLPAEGIHLRLFPDEVE